MTAATWRALVGTRLWTTHDAGVHWTAIQTTLPRGYTPLAVQFVSPITGWAIAARIYQPDNVAADHDTPVLRIHHRGCRRRIDTQGMDWTTTLRALRTTVTFMGSRALCTMERLCRR
jgi:hypothetical protein